MGIFQTLYEIILNQDFNFNILLMPFPLANPLMVNEDIAIFQVKVSHRITNLWVVGIFIVSVKICLIRFIEYKYLIMARMMNNMTSTRCNMTTNMLQSENSVTFYIIQIDAIPLNESETFINKRKP